MGICAFDLHGQPGSNAQIPIIIRFLLVADLAHQIFDFPQIRVVPLKWSPLYQPPPF
jgi:hypothetical protein